MNQTSALELDIITVHGHKNKFSTDTRPYPIQYVLEKEKTKDRD